jgi:hypothetical protein
VRQGAAEERRAAGAPAEQLQRLHRHDDQPEPAREREPARVGDDGLDLQAHRAPAQRLQQRRVGVQRDHRGAAGGQVEADAAGPRADVQDRPAGLVGQRAPQRQVLGVPAAIEVVPERVEVHGAASLPGARGRRIGRSG